MENRIVIVSSIADDIVALKSALDDAHEGPFYVESVSTLQAAVQEVRQGAIDVIIVDLTLPDGRGLACFDRLYEVARHTPILTLCDRGSENECREALRRGAQGWLSKDCFDKSLVPQLLRNIVERVKAEQDLYVAHARAEITLDSVEDAVISADRCGRVDYLNAAAEQLIGCSRHVVRGMLISEVLKTVDSGTGQGLTSSAELVLLANPASGLIREACLVARSGERVPIEESSAPVYDWDGELVGAVIVFRDISDSVVSASKMRHQAQHDFLTNLPNRMLLNDRIGQAIGLAKRSDIHPALLFLDLDKFKQVNDSLGHTVGDRLLQAVSERLVSCVRTSDTVSRHGGDEFVILLADERRPEDAALTAEKVIEALSMPFQIDEQELQISTSIGISLFPLDGTDAPTLIKNADTAMYHAKERGRKNYQFFRQDMNARAFERQLVESNLRRALERSEFTLYYQPKIDLETGRIIGVEALLRWQHPDWGLVPPQRFIPIAEESGLIVPIGRWVLREACAQAVRWRSLGISPVSIAVNVSALEFSHREFFEHTLAVVDATGLDPVCLQLEVTESVLMRDVIASAALLARFKAVGVQIAVDDFGTGYSSLSYLNQFPIDVLKIDQSFVRAIDPVAGRDSAIVSAVIGVGKNLKQRVIAEGVEHAGQLAFLKAHQCNEGQGYLFGRPIDATQMQALLNNSVRV